MANENRDCLLRQLETAWALTSFHLDGLTTDHCSWRPAAKGLHVREDADGKWLPDWPDHEGYDLGPPSIAWLTWHIGFWWSMVLDHSFGAATLAREDVSWPGDAERARAWIERLHGEWRAAIEKLTDDELLSHERARWPVSERPFGDIVAWVNLELMKNASEIGYARFLHGASRPSG
ncbi:MAG: DinB family protein [Labilithrix sp.]|nr:DinB family protein [Labilithrix sp.]